MRHIMVIIKFRVKKNKKTEKPHYQKKLFGGGEY